MSQVTLVPDSFQVWTDSYLREIDKEIEREFDRDRYFRLLVVRRELMAYRSLASDVAVS